MTEIQKIEKDFFDEIGRINHYNEAIALLAWDLRTGAPKNGHEQRSEVIGTLSQERYNMLTSDKMGELLEGLNDPREADELSEVTRVSAKEMKKEYDENKKIPPEEFREYTILTSKSESAWVEAKEKSDFSMLEPYLEKLVDFNHRFADYWGHDGNKYDRLLDRYEPGMTTDKIDALFGELKTSITPLVQEIADSPNQPETGFLYEHFPADRQEAFSRYLLNEIGYDFNGGKLDETEHPFMISLNPGDVRVTTHYKENDFRMAVFGTIHEGGHGIYEQNISKELNGTPLATGTSNGIHESQSLFFENFVGRNRGFWDKHYDRFKTYTSGQFDNVSVDDYYRAINVAGPSLIRIEADELTYPLHIILRYEIEKGLFNGDLKVKDLPGIWNEKMEELVGIAPVKDRDGVLQDIHWSGGDFGYFPSYALGYIYAAQFKEAIDKEFSDYDGLLREGRVSPIREWLTENVHQYGKLKTPREIIQGATGQDVSAKPLINYLNKKYREVYQMSQTF